MDAQLSVKASTTTETPFHSPARARLKFVPLRSDLSPHAPLSARQSMGRREPSKHVYSPNLAPQRCLRWFLETGVMMPLSTVNAWPSFGAA